VAEVRQPKTPITVNEIKETELYGVVARAVGEDNDLSNPAIMRKLYAAEDFYERDLQIRFGITRVFSDAESRVNHSDATLRITDFDPIRDISEPAYDYQTNLWSDDQWAMIKLRHRPIRSVTQMVFTWAGARRVWTVPADWVKPDRPYGTINLVPTSGAAVMMTFSAFILSVIAGGRGLPHSIFIDYTTGYSEQELCYHHNDLLDGIRLRALLLLGGIISNIATGGRQSSSLSLDGLSHSRGFGGKYGAYTGAIQIALEQEKEIRENWREKERGVVVEFL